MDETAKKKALRMLTYGLYLATAADGERLAAGTINWFSQSSFDPPLVMAAIKCHSSLHEVISSSRLFALHILAKAQWDMAVSFFKTAKQVDNMLNGYRFERGATGAPVFLDAPAWIECRVVDEVPRGDHTVFIAQVVNAGLRREEEPLTLRDTGFFYGG